MNAGLKNRGKTVEDIEEKGGGSRVHHVKLAWIPSCRIDPIFANKNIENTIGTIQLPLGFVGAVNINGNHATGDFVVPMATASFGTMPTISCRSRLISRESFTQSINNAGDVE